MTSQQIQDGGRLPCWKWLYCHLSEKSCDFDAAADLELHDSHV